MKKSYSILLVDDEESVLRMLMAFFSRSGHHPICAQNGLEAVELFKQQSPDIVLMDIRIL